MKDKLISKKENVYELPKEGKMNVPGRIYSSESLLSHPGMDSAINQVSNVAELPGIKTASLAMPDIGGSITSALSFTNISLNVFGCELNPNEAVSDYYTFCSGGDAQASSDQPSSESVSEAIDPNNAVETPEGEPFAEPHRGTPDVDNRTSGMEKPTQDLEVGESNAETRALSQEERDFAPDSTIIRRELTADEQTERQAAIDSLELE